MKEQQPELPVPPGWRKIDLKDLVTEEQSKDIWKIMNETGDSIKRVRELTAYLNGFREQLIDKNVLPEFLAYSLEYRMQYERGSQAVKNME
jgi:hypothetical protein